MALVANRVTWASSQFPSARAKAYNQFWSTGRTFDEFDLEEVVSLLNGSASRLELAFPSTTDRIPTVVIESWLNIWLRLAQLTVDRSLSLPNEKRIPIISLLRNQILIVRRGEEIVSRSQRSIWHRWSEEIEKTINAMN